MSIIKVDFDSLKEKIEKINRLNEEMDDLIINMDTINNCLNNDEVWNDKSRVVYVNSTKNFHNEILKDNIYENVLRFSKKLNEYVEEYEKIENKYAKINIDL